MTEDKVKNDMEVCMFGSAYSMLLNALAESPGDQEGFLVGSRVRRSYRQNSDTSSRTDKQTTLVHISATIPLRGHKVYTASGQAWKEAESEQLRKTSQHKKEIIGFYQLRKGDIIKPSLKDRRLMLAAEEAFGEPFIYLIVGESVTENRATYKYTSIAYLAKQKPIPVLIKIPNLGKGEKMDPNSGKMEKVGGLEYIKAPVAVAQSSETSHGYLEISKWPEQVDCLATIVNRFDHIHEAVVEETERLKEELMVEERERKQLEKEVQELMEQLEAGREVSREEILAGDLATALEAVLPPRKEVLKEPASDDNDSENSDDDRMPLVKLIRVPNLPAHEIEVDR